MEIDRKGSFSSIDSKKHSIIYSGLDYAFTSITALIFYLLFSEFTSDSSYYNGISCKDLLSTSEKLESFYYYLFIIYLIMLAINILSSLHRAIEQFAEIARLIVLIFSLLIGLIYLFKITIDINFGETCGQLRLLALVVAIIGWISITLFCCIACVTLTILMNNKC